MTATPLRQPTPRLVDDSEQVHSTSPSRFGDDVWDLSELLTAPGCSERTMRLAGLPSGWDQAVRETLFCLLNPMHSAVLERGHVSHRRAGPRQIVSTHQRLRVLAAWADAEAIASPSSWTLHHSGRLLAALRAGLPQASGRPLTPAAQTTYADALLILWDFRDALSEPLPAHPWGGRTAARAVGYQQSAENLTAPLAWTVWSAAMRAAWVVVDQLGDDIVAASTKRRRPAPRTTVASCDAPAALSEHLRAGGRLAVHTGYGRRPRPRGTISVPLVARALGVSGSTLNPATSGYNAALDALLQDAIARPEHRWFGGLHQPNGPLADPAWEWGTGEVEHLESVLRGAAYLLLAGLTAMRDSELQALERDCRTAGDGNVPALRSVQRKGIAAPGGTDRVWFAPKPVFRAVEVLEALTPHERLLFARSPAGGSYVASRDIARFVRFVNAPACERVGRGPDLDLDPIDETTPLNQQAMRRSFAVYAARYPGAELGLGIQLGHAALRMTSGYFSDGQQQVSKLMDDERRTVARDLVRTIASGTTAGTGGGTARLRAHTASVVVSTKRAGRLITRLAADYHFGSLNDCHYVPDTAECGADGPHLAERLCGSHRCGNAVITSRHAPAWQAHLERIDRQLGVEHLHPSLERRLRDERARVVEILAAGTQEP